MLVDELRTDHSALRIKKEVERKYQHIVYECKNAAEYRRSYYEGLDSEARNLRHHSTGGYSAVDVLMGRGGIYNSEWNMYGISYEYDSCDPKKRNITRSEAATVASELEKKLKAEGFKTVQTEVRNGWEISIYSEGSKKEKYLSDYGIWVRVTW